MNCTRSVIMFLLLLVLLLNYNLNFSAVAYKMMSNICRMMNHRGKQVSYQNYTQHLYPRSVRHYEEYFHQDDMKQASREGQKADTEPLFLTPYINNSRFIEAVKLSRVKNPLNRRYDSYSGFLTVNETYKSHMFFWFFPTTNESVAVPLIVWLEGGSKYASSSRVFQTMGPYVLEDGRIRNNTFHLLEHYHVLYLDTPIGSGFSFSEDARGYSRSIEAAAEDIYQALEQFSSIFHEYMNRGIFLTGELFMSKVAVAAAHRIQNNRSNSSNDKFAYSILGLILPNAFVDPLNMIGTSEFLYQLGIVDGSGYEEMRYLEKETKRFIRSSDWSAANKLYRKIMSKLNELGYEHPYDFTRPLADTDMGKTVSKLLSRKGIREAIHVGDLSYEDNENLFCYMENDYLRSVSDLITDLVMKGHRFLFYTGQLGIEVS